MSTLPLQRQPMGDALKRAALYGPSLQRLSKATEPVRVRYQALANRERALVLVTLLVAGAALWDQTLRAPAAAEYAELRTQADAVALRLSGAQQFAQTLASTNNHARLAQLRGEQQVMLQQTKALDAQLTNAMAGFVAPAEVNRLLTDVLRRHPGLHLVKAESLAPTPLVSVTVTTPGAVASAVPSAVPSTGATSKAAGDSAVSQEPQLYRHGLALELSGSYLDAYAYLVELEALPWGLRWDRVSYEVVEHPVGRLVLQLHTLSTGPAWIGT